VRREGQAPPGPTARMQELLSDTQREVLRLRIAHGLSAEQTALVLGLTPAAVRLTQHQALKALRDALATRSDAPPS
jgi:DNA-directed RNA polymerase specialized sigma24 family protein